MLFNFQNSRSQKIFERLDMFGVPITIRFNGNTNHKTVFGSIITLCILFVLLYYITETVTNLLNYENYNVVFQENIVKQPTPFELKPSQFSFAFGIQDTFLKTLRDEQIYYFEAVYADTRRKFNEKTQQFEFTTNYTSFQPVPCTPQHFQVQGTQDYFLKLPYKDLYCLPLDMQMFFEGQFGADIYKWLRFRLKKCTDPTKCKPKTEVDSHLSNCNFQVYYVNYAVEITDRQQPFKPIGQNTFWKPSSTLKNINMYFRNTFVNSDEGIFQSDIKKHQALLYSFDREQVVNTQSDTLFEYYVQLEKNKESQYLRKYEKVNQAVSQLGGLFNFLFALGAVICFPYSKLVLNQKLLNSIFQFQSKNDQSNQQKEISFQWPQQQQFQNNNQKDYLISNQQYNDQQSEQISQLRMLNSNPTSPNKFSFSKKKQLQLDEQRGKVQSSISGSKSIGTNIVRELDSFKEDNQQQNQTQKQLSSPSKFILNFKKQIQNQLNNKYMESLFKVKVNQIKVKVKDIFKSYFTQRYPHQKMINYGMEKLNYHLDIDTIIIKLLEIEKLKQLVLNEQQIKLFEFIPQPVIHEELFEKQTNEELEMAQQQNPLLKTGIFYEDRRTIIQKASDAQEAYNQIFKTNESKITSIDRKLISLLDPRVSSKLDQNIFKSIQDPFITIERSQPLSKNDKNQQNANINQISTENPILLGHQNNTTCNRNTEELEI